jgi:hypothetical protein
VIRPFKDIFFLLNLKKRVSQRITVESQRITSVSQAYHSVSLTPASNFDTPTFRAGATLLTVLARGSAEGVPGAATLLTVLARGSAQAVPWAVSVLTVTTIHESLKAVSLLESPSNCVYNSILQFNHFRILTRLNCGIEL